MAEGLIPDIEVKVTADTSAFDSALNRAEANGVGFQKDLEQKIAEAINGVRSQFGDLGGEIDNAMAELQARLSQRWTEIFQDALKKSQDAAKSFPAAMGDGSNLMASVEKQITESGASITEEVKTKYDEIAKAAEEAAKSAEGSVQGFFALTAAFGLGSSAADILGKALEYVIRTVAESIAAYAAFEQETIAISHAMKNAGVDITATNDMLSELGEQLGDSVGVGKAYATLLQFRTISKDTFPELIRVSSDLATQAKVTGTGLGNLSSVARLVGRAMEDPASAMGRLSQSSLTLDPLTQALVKHYIQMGDTAKASTTFINALKKSVSGMTDAVNSSTLGALRRYQEQVELNKAATGSWFVEILNGFGILEAYTEHLKQINELRGVLGTQPQIAALKEELDLMLKRRHTGAEEAMIRQKIATLEKQVADSAKESEARAESIASLALKRQEAIKLTLSDQFDLAHMTERERELTEAVNKARAEGLILTQADVTLFRTRMDMQNQFLEGIKRAQEYHRIDAAITANNFRIQGSMLEARKAAFQGQMTVYRDSQLRIKGTDPTKVDDEVAAKWREFYSGLDAEAAAAERAISNSTAALNDQITALAKGSAASAAYTLEQNAIRAAVEAGHPYDPTEIQRLAEAYGAATLKLQQWKIQLDLTFETQTMFLDDAEKRIATMMRDLYGQDWQKHMDDAVANQIRFNDYLKQAEGYTQSFMSSFVSGVMDGVDAVESLQNAFKDLAKQLIQMAMNRFIMMLFQGIASSFGAGALQMGTGATPATQPGSTFENGFFYDQPVMHTGGIVGEEPTETRKVPMSIFDTAPRFHTGGIADEDAKREGLKPNEVPAVLKKGEGVFTPEQMAELAPAPKKEQKEEVLPRFHEGGIVGDPIVLKPKQKEELEPILKPKQKKELEPSITVTPRIMHTGGIVGKGQPKTRTVQSILFEDAPRFHEGGMLPGEMPAILKKGEGVFTPEQMAALGGGEATIINNVKVINNAPNTKTSQNENKNDSGGIDLEVMIDQINTKLISQPGSGTSRALGGMGVTPTRTRR